MAGIAFDIKWKLNYRHKFQARCVLGGRYCLSYRRIKWCSNGGGNFLGGSVAVKEIVTVWRLEDDVLDAWEGGGCRVPS